MKKLCSLFVLLIQLSALSPQLLAQTNITIPWEDVDKTGAVASDVAAVDPTRTINTTAPLTGGGDLSADRTLAVSAATTSAAGVVELATTAEAIAGTDTTRPPSVAASEARHLYGDAGRAPAPFLLFDGATSGRRGEVTPGADGAVAGLPIIVPFEFDVPTHNPGSNADVFVFTASAGTSAHGVRLVMLTNGSLMLAQYGADTAVNARALTNTVFRAAYSGLRIKGMVVFESGDTTTAPKIYVQGVDITSSFALSFGSGGEGGAPNWMPSTLVTTKFLSGYNWPAGRLIPHAPLLGALTDADALAWTQTGLLPNWCYAGTGSVVVTYASDFSAGTDSFLPGTGITATGNIDTDADDAGIPPSDDWLRLERTTGSGLLYVSRTFTGLAVGEWAMVDVDLYVPAGSGYDYVACGQIAAVTATTDGSNGRQFQAVSPGLNRLRFIFKVSNTVNLFIPTNSGGVQIASLPVGTKLYVKNVQVRHPGPIARHTLQPGAVVHPDDGANKLPLLITSGVTAVGTAPRIYTIQGTLTWSGTHEAKALLADQALLPSNAVIESIVLVADASTSGAGISVGDGDTTSYWVAASAHTANTPKYQTLAQRFPASSATADLKIYVDPDDANYTGPVSVTVNYSLR